MALPKTFYINDKMRDFAKFYKGDTLEALRTAGYTGSEEYLKQLGRDLLKQPEIIKMIQDFAKIQQSRANAIADKEEIQAFLSNTMRNEDHDWKRELDEHGMVKELGNLSMASRLKAAELLGKTQGIFVDKVDISGKVSITDIIRDAYHVEDEDLDAIEAEYNHVKELKKIKQITGHVSDPLEEYEGLV